MSPLLKMGDAFFRETRDGRHVVALDIYPQTTRVRSCKLFFVPDATPITGNPADCYRPPIRRILQGRKFE